MYFKYITTAIYHPFPQGTNNYKVQQYDKINFLA